MRITKKWLKNAKSQLTKRLSQLCNMTHTELRAEFTRMWPDVALGCSEPHDLIRQMMEWAIGVAFPE
jgi:hypothetical protein